MPRLAIGVGRFAGRLAPPTFGRAALWAHRGRHSRVPNVVAACVLLSIAAVGWALALPAIPLRQIGDLGLVTVLPLPYFLALLVVTISFALAIRQSGTPGWLLFSHVALLIAVVHGTPSLSYGTLRYAWAWKHVGMVDYIQRWGSVNLDTSTLSALGAYHNWPGFFALGASFTELGGFVSALDFAPLAPLFFNLVDLGALLLLFGALTDDRRRKWVAVWLFFLANWIGQDYFAPQALSYFLFLVVIGICLTWFRVDKPLTNTSDRTSGPVTYLASLSRRLLERGEAHQMAGDRVQPFQRVALMAIIVLLLMVIATTHQLTPFVAILSLGVLVALRECAARGLPRLMMAITGTWMIYVAWAFTGANFAWIVHSIGDLDRNASVSDLTRVGGDQVIVAYAARGLSATVGILAVAGLIRRWHQGRLDRAAIALVAAPFPMLLLSPYGGEMSFRVYFFALPCLAFLGAAVFFPSQDSGRSWRCMASLVVVSAVLLAGLLFAYYGRERLNNFTPLEVDAAEHLYSMAPAGSLVLGASDNYPAVFHHYEQYNHRALVGRRISGGQLERLRDDPVNVVIEEMIADVYPATYLIITRSQRAQIELDGLMPAGAIERLERLVTQSDSFKVVYQNEDAVILTLSSQ